MNIAENNSEENPSGNEDAAIEVLLKNALEGSEAAFKKIYEIYSGRMYSLCQRYAGKGADADDLFQESFIKIFKNLSSYKGVGSFEGWVRRIFVNTCLDYLKKKKTLLFTGDIETIEDIHPLTEAHNATLQNDELMKIIQQLPDGYRSIVNLYLVEGYSHKEIADMLGISEGTSKSQLSKAKAKLQEIIALLNE